MPSARIPKRVALHDLPLSHYCVKARLVLGYKGVPFERVPAPYHDRQHLITVSGQDYVPYLEWGRTGVTWPDIADFLEARVPEPTLYPDGSRAVARMLESWAHDALEERVWRYVVSDAAATFDDPRERWVFEEIQTRARGPLELMAKRKRAFKRDVDTALDLVEDALRDRPYLVADAPSLADFAVYGALHPLWYTGNSVPASRRRFHAWKRRVEDAGNLTPDRPR